LGNTVKLQRDTTELEATRPANRASHSKVRLLTLSDLDARTNSARRAFELCDKIVSERGGQDHMGTLRFLLANDVAACSAMIEDSLARWLRGEPIDVAQLSTLLNCRRRDAALLGVDPDPKNVTPQSLADIAAEIEAEEAATAAQENAA
jgi:hypothetical protein